MPERILSLAGASNFRDLGGYPTTDGRLTRWGRLFRSDSLHELTPADLGVLAGLGLRGVIDLRTETELERTGRGPLADASLTFLHAPVVRVEGGESVGAPSFDDEPGARYLWYLEEGRGTLAAAIEMVATPDHLPLVFHCTAGKDRTGVLAALVLELLGVEQEVIVADYLLTEGRMELIRERLRRDPRIGDRIDQVPAARLAVKAVTMERFLDGLHRRHGGARRWAEEAGVSLEAIDRLPSLFLEEAA